MSKKILKNLGICILGVSCLSLGVAFSQNIKNGLNNIKDKIDEVIPSTTTKPVEDNNIEDTVLVDGEVVKTGSVVDMPQKLTFRKASANTEGITINATVLPENATNKSLTWSVAWSRSDLSYNINEFIEIIPSTDTLSCEVRCLQPLSFMAYIEVVCGDIRKTIDVGYIPLYPISDGYDFSVVSYDQGNNWIDEYIIEFNNGVLSVSGDEDNRFGFMAWNYKDLSTDNYYSSSYGHFDSERYFKVGEESFNSGTYDIDVLGVSIRLTQDFYSILQTRWSEIYSSSLSSFVKSGMLYDAQGLDLLNNFGLQDFNILRYFLNSSISSNQIDLIVDTMEECCSKDIYIFELEVNLACRDMEGNVVYSYDYVGSFNPEIKEKYVAVSDISLSSDKINFEE